LVLAAHAAVHLLSAYYRNIKTGKLTYSAVIALPNLSEVQFIFILAVHRNYILMKSQNNDSVHCMSDVFLS